MNPATALLCTQATALALARWEPRIRLRQARLSGDFAAGEAVMNIVADRTDSPSPNALVRLSIPLR